MAPKSPTVASWELGRRLREKREETGYSSATAARRVGVAPAYLSDVENGKKKLAKERLRVVVEEYGFDANEAEELEALREEASHRGWWNSYSGIFSDDLLRFIGYEYGAASVRVHDGGLVNGLLQTEDYARAVMEAGAPNLRLAHVDRQLKARMMRQRRVFGDEPVRLTAVMSEAAVRQQVGGPEVLAGQLRRLLDVIDTRSETVEIRVVPFSAPAHPAMNASSFHVMTFPSPRLPTIVWQESVTSTQLISDPLTARDYALSHAEAMKTALNRNDSADLMKKVVKELES